MHKYAMRILLSLLPILWACEKPGKPLVADETIDPAALRVSTKLTADDWPWWRGPQRDGHANPKNLPTRFSPSENVLWKAPVPGRGHSSPIAVGEQVFLTTADEASEIQSVIAFDLNSGTQQWKRDINHGAFPANNHPKNTEASATPASDGERLFVTFFHHKQIELTALDLTGVILWQKSVGPFDPKMFEYGYAPSPVLYGSSVIVVAEHDGESSLVAFDRQSGNELWRTPRRASISFSSPVVAHAAGHDQLLLSGQDKVCSYDPKDGRLLWEVAGTSAATCGTMIWTGNTVFASGGYPKAETLAVQADGTKRVLWKNSQKCYEQSMIVIEGYVYALTEKGILHCWRASDGEEQWRKRLEGPVSASPVYAGGHIYWANEAATFYVFRATPESFQLTEANRMGSEAFASPAVVKDRLLVRIAEVDKANRQEFLYCIGKSR